MARHWVRKRLLDPVDVSWLIFLRIGFGTLLVWHAVSYLMEGRVERSWIAPSFHFKFPYFEWLAPWPGAGMILHFYGLAILGGFIALGFLYRSSSLLFFLAFTYVFLLEQARYQNHTYLICLLSFLGIFLPAHRRFSLDSLLWPSIRTSVVPAWTVTLAQFQVGIPYFFGGIAKLNRDWFHGEPLREWLPRENDFPFIGAYFHEDWMVHCFGLAGLLLDLLAVPLLLCKRTRIAAFAALFLFHCTNARLFTLGVFPWLMIVLTTAFFPPHLVRGVSHVMRHHRMAALLVLGAAACAAWLAVWSNEQVAFAPIFAGATAGLVIAGSLSTRWIRGCASDWDSGASATVAPLPPSRGGRRRVAVAMGLWVLGQSLIPLRHLAIPGNVAWT